MKTIYQLKEEGHNLIYELQEKGMKTYGHRGIYAKMRRKLKCEAGKEHFSRMHKETEVIKAIQVLEKMLGKQTSIIESPDHIDYRKTILPRAERLKAMEALKLLPKPVKPLWKRILARIGVVI